MEEQSHKDDMRAALRGDFERMRRRQAGDSEQGRAVSSVTAVTPGDADTPVESTSAASWLDRLRGRT